MAEGDHVRVGLVGRASEDYDLLFGDTLFDSVETRDMNILRYICIRIVWDGPRLPVPIARLLIDFGMGQKGKKIK